MPDDMPDATPEKHPAAWRYALKRTVHVLVVERVADIAATLAFYGMLSAFPALLAVLSLFGVFGHGQQSAQSLMSFAGQVLPKQTIAPLRGTLTQFASSGNAGIGAFVGIVVALWTASRYVNAFGGALNRVYGVQEGRRLVKHRLTELAITLAIVALGGILLFVVLLSRPLLTAPNAPLALGHVGAIVWAVLQWPIVVAAAVMVIVLLYWGTPNVKQPRLRWLTLGGVTALVLMAAATVAFGFYATSSSTFHREYGALAGLIVFLVWLWLMNLMLLFGATYDVELERARELKEGVDASRTVQLPMRDHRRVVRLQHREDELATEASRLMR